jgi:hypothetical protein
VAVRRTIEAAMVVQCSADALIEWIQVVRENMLACTVYL